MSIAVMHEHHRYIQTLIDRGGPSPEDYQQLDSWIKELYHGIDTGVISSQAFGLVRGAFESILTTKTMHGWAYTKPHGYPGDFEIIDRHYLNHVASEPHLASWDRYWQAGAAAKAVRNRKTYFHTLLAQQCEGASGHTVNVLNVASGPARDVFEFLLYGSENVHFYCIDHDPKAIAHSSSLCGSFPNHVTFIEADVLRFKPSRTYELIWSAGLFDYFNDRIFTKLIRRLLASVAPGGQLVIGNFSNDNPNYHWLKFCEWLLHHRSKDQLITLAIEAGAHPEHVFVAHEPERVNLFLHITRPKNDT